MAVARKINIDNFESYFNEIVKIHKTKKATEHSYRGALQVLLESLENNLTAINEPKRIKCGAPDYIISRKRVPIGYIEAKDVGENLDKIEKSDQLNRYFSSLSNLVLTDYLEFRWYVNGQKRLTAKIGEVKNGKIVLNDDQSQIKLLLDSFLGAELPTIKTAEELAGRLASSSKSICSLIIDVYNEEEEDGWLHRWLKAFSEVLINELEPSTFADMFAQTLAYGFFAARVHHNSDVEFSRFETTRILPKTNPFLRQLFAQFAGPNMPDEINWAVDEIVEILKRTDVQSIMKSFGGETGKDDPVVHFYETFLTAYNPSLREHRGVYYTPEPVVSYITKSVDEILEKKFKRENGLADDKTLILDPATGTASFLYKIVEEIYKKFDGDLGAWDSYVSDTLLNRIFGFEILMAPYSVAHLKLGLQLQETGYKFQKNQRLGVFLTNTLEETAKKSQEMLFDWISSEANEASSIKQDKPIMVVIGNPPYSGQSANNGEWINGLMRGYDSITGNSTANYFEVDGKPLNEKNSKWINDDYVKFIRFAQWRIEQTGHGVLAFVTNHAYLSNPTFRGMRQSLLEGFDEIFILDLHGNSKRKETAPDGGKDQNVFDIQQGVSIGFFVKKEGSKKSGYASVYHADVYGERNVKYDFLLENTLSSTKFKKIDVVAPFYVFEHQDGDKRTEYLQGWKLTDIFPVHGSGITTARDHVVIGFEKSEVLKNAEFFRNSKLSDKEVCAKLQIPLKKGWSVERSRRLIKHEKNLESNMQTIMYRPFDKREIFYHDSLVWRTVRKVMGNMIEGDNIALVTARSNKSEIQNQFYVSKFMTEAKTGESTTQSALFPLYCYANNDGFDLGDNKTINIKDEYLTALKKEFGSKDIETRFFYYIYALFNSSEYRTRYAEFLKMDFPRVLVSKDEEFFSALSELGRKIVQLHTMNFGNTKSIVKFPTRGSNEVGLIKYITDSKEIMINHDQSFTNIPLKVWEYEVGGHQVLSKWLKARKGRTLISVEIQEFKNIAYAIEQSIDVQSSIDELIEVHGGYPFKEVLQLEADIDEVIETREKINKLKDTIVAKKKRKKTA